MKEYAVTNRKGSVLCAVVAALVLMYGALLAWGSYTGFPRSTIYAGHMPYLIDKPMGEDGFYMLTVAHNIATKHRILYNGDLQTTGIQPLATFVFAAIDCLVIYFGGGALALIRGVLLFGVALSIVFAWIMGRITEQLAPEEWRAPAFTLGFLLTLLNYALFRLFTYGLETGVYLMCLAGCLAVIVRIGRRGSATMGEAVLLGLAAGFCGEARIDFGVLFAFLLLLMIVRKWISLAQATVSAIIAAILVSPWFLYLHEVTGSWIPSSGKAESRMISLIDAGTRVKTILLSILAEAAPWSFGGMSKLTTLVTIVSAVIVCWLWFSDAGKRLRTEAPLAVSVALLWVPGLLFMALVYVVFFSSTHFYLRYMSPWAIITTPLLALLLCALPTARRNAGLVGAGLVVMFSAWTFGSLHTGRVSNTQTIATGFVLEHYPQVHIGAFQSGAMGFADSNVENLDGKLNMEAYTAYKKKRMPEFIDKEGIQMIVDWPSVIELFLPKDYLERQWQPCPTLITGTESECLQRRHDSQKALN